jgi:hypothetical protein
MIKKRILTFSIATLVIASAIFLVWKEKERREIAEKNRLRIGVISDIHKCAGYNEDLTPFISTTEKKKTAFNVSLGDDINFRVGNCSSSYKEDLEWVMDNLKSKVPIHFVLGDHDMDVDEAYDFWMEKMNREKNYYSFDKDTFHIVILDTILGGESMRPTCEKDTACAVLLAQYEELRKIRRDPKLLKKYYKDNNLGEEALYQMFKSSEEAYESERSRIQDVRSSGRRDIGRISETELNWLRDDLMKTDKSKVIVFSDHPLFHFISPRKEYNIKNGERLREVFRNSQKQIVSISGEAHLWHEENIDGIQYYIVDKYSSEQKRFAIFEWTQDGFFLNKFAINK